MWSPFCNFVSSKSHFSQEKWTTLINWRAFDWDTLYLRGYSASSSIQLYSIKFLWIMFVKWKVNHVCEIKKVNHVCEIKKGRHCCSVGELKITFASTCKESVFNVLFNVLFLVLDFPLGAPNTLLEHVIERSIWRIVVGEGSWWGWGSVKIGDWVFDLVGIFPWLRSFGLTFRLLVLREYSYLGVYLSAVTIWSMPFVLVSCC